MKHKLSETSEKVLRDFEFGDFLYETKNGELTGDSVTNGQRNLPIAVCVINQPQMGCCRFISLRYMSLANPQKGSEMDDKSTVMRFGYRGCDCGTNCAPGETRNQTRYCTNDSHWKSSSISGEKDYQTLLNAMSYYYGKLAKKSKQAAYDELFANVLSGDNQKGIILPVICTYRFHTKATQQGDWYVPSPSELYLAFGRKINVKNLKEPINDNTPTSVANDATWVKGIDYLNQILIENGYPPFSKKYYYHTSREEGKGLTAFYSVGVDQISSKNKFDDMAVCLPFISVMEDF